MKLNLYLYNSFGIVFVKWFVWIAFKETLLKGLASYDAADIISYFLKNKTITIEALNHELKNFPGLSSGEKGSRPAPLNALNGKLLLRMPGNDVMPKVTKSLLLKPIK